MATPTIHEQLRDDLLASYTLHLPDIEAGLPDFMNQDRRKAAEDFRKNGLPDKRLEEYKNTPIDKMFFGGYRQSFSPENLNMDVNEVFHCDVPELDTDLVFLVNGQYLARPDALTVKPDGVIFGSLSEAARRFPEIVSAHYGKYARMYPDRLANLNMAFARDGLFLYIPDGVKAEKPIQLVNLVVASEQIMLQPRNLFITGKDASATLIVCDHSFFPNPFLLNGVMEMYAGENSSVEYYRMQNAHDHSVQISNTSILQEAGSKVHSSLITLQGGTVRNNIFVKLNGKGAVNNTNGLYLADKNQHIDNHLIIDHQAPGCESSQYFKGILDNQSTGIFSGRIHVAKDAQQTQAYQQNHSLVLSDEAKARTKPQLEIYADDVKCSHGATVGQLDEDAMFYLRSRGISKKEACHLLMFGFAQEVVKSIKVPPLQDEINGLVEKRLRGELSRCNRCTLHCK
jgi:Fe-S cluster assembly protein SufD